MLFTDEWQQEERIIDILHGGIWSFQYKKISVEMTHMVYLFVLSQQEVLFHIDL